jgi:hypothetical protein
MGISNVYVTNMYKYDIYIIIYIYTRYMMLLVDTLMPDMDIPCGSFEDGDSNQIYETPVLCIVLQCGDFPPSRLS